MYSTLSINELFQKKKASEKIQTADLSLCKR